MNEQQWLNRHEMHERILYCIGTEWSKQGIHRIYASMTCTIYLAYEEHQVAGDGFVFTYLMESPFLRVCPKLIAVASAMLIVVKSAVGYTLGLVGQDPITAGKTAPEFSEGTAPTCLNVSLHLDPEKRNQVVEWAADHFKSPTMTRMSVFIIKLGKVIVEFHRNLKNV